ncbi:MAG: hypothetical protein KME03_00410 [Aphanocapsa lilacina HA4352-LM1]|jgi:GTPase SAR1 family protein|nr:hypothetical protein [Aphanocapsa lilacina HA4352-LM1]
MAPQLVIPSKTFTLLSIGQRGVGKTVFLAGSCAHLLERRGSSQLLWFESKDGDSRKQIDKILEYMARTGEYPPATAAVSTFQFSLKCRSALGTRTLCHFRWQDIPGEICHVLDPAFRQMILTSNGCCTFLDAEALLEREDYLEEAAGVIEQVMLIANLVALNRLKYAFTLVLTKCDRLRSQPQLAVRLEERLQPVLEQLQVLGCHYRVFQSGMVLRAGAPVPVEATAGVDALVWLVSEVNKAHRDRWTQTVGRWLVGLLGGGSANQTERGALGALLVSQPFASKPH